MQNPPRNDRSFQDVPEAIRKAGLSNSKKSHCEGGGTGCQPFHWQHERLQGREEYKLRVGDWRVLYEFDLPKNELYLLTVRHRREVYR